jgi:tRNA threonylcarbamoyladenosine modification (KEOPS) complex  Pcc1 subunit
MKLEAEIRVIDVNVEAIAQCFVAEHDAMQTQRSTVTMNTSSEGMMFKVVAKDPTALRATLHGITKLLTVYQKGMENGSTRKN